MRIRGSANVLSDQEIDLITDRALRILSDIGVTIPNAKMLEVLAGFGASVDIERQRVLIPRGEMEVFLDSAVKFSLYDNTPLLVSAGAYPQYYMPPGTRSAELHTVETVSNMTRLLDKLDNIHMLYDSMGVPSDVPAALAPLHMRLITWKYTRKGGCGQIQLTNLCPYAVEMAQVMADARGGRLGDYAFLNIEMISPLQFGREEAEQFVYFWERGLRANVGNIVSAGGTGPATLAGAVALNLAENLFLNFLSRAFFGTRTMGFSNSVTVLDMKRGVFQYGRPELGLTHLVMGQLARHFGAFFGANSFLGDAKVPSCEHGMQKGLNAIPAILAGTISLGNLGLLSVDEIGSPLQLIIDNEYAGALLRLARGFEISEENLALDLIEEMGPGGFFAGTEHTAQHYRKEHWQPAIFSREMYNSWMAQDGKIDIERAGDIFDSVMQGDEETYIDEDVEKALLQIIARAEKDLL